MKHRTRKHFGERFQPLLVAVFVTAFLVLFGCGGGGGSSSSGGGGAANTAPTADDGTLTTDENVAAAGALSADDADGDALTYSIVANGALGTANITNPDTGSYTYTPDANVNGIDTFTFKVNDGTEDSNTATMTVTIKPVNTPPQADAGDPQTVNEQTPVNLDGSGSDDIEDGAAGLSYAWTQIITGTEPTVDLIDADTDTPSFTAPAVSASTQLTFELEVTDTGTLSDTDQVTVTVDNAGNLAGSVAPAPDIVDLDVEGGLDWSHWGLVDTTSFNQKAGVTEQIGDYQDIGSIVANRFNNNSPTAFTWSTGTPTGAVPDPSGTGLFFITSSVAIDEGVRFIVPAGISEKTLKVYLGTTSAEAKFTATLSDVSAPPYEVLLDNTLPVGKFTATLSDVSAPPYEVLLDNTLPVGKVRVVTLNFGAAADGEFLTIDFTLSADTGPDAGGALNFLAATLED
jgi:hypothetical protein